MPPRSPSVPPAAAPLAAVDLAPYALRPMQLDDIDTVMAIEARAFPTPWSAAGYAHELTQNKLATYDVLTVAAPDGTTALIGFTGAWLLVDEWHISTIAVDPPWRGRGLGALLLLDMLWAAYARGAALATLEVRDHNPVARQLYEKMGFVTVGRRPRYYRDTGEDAIIMTLEPLDAAYRRRLHALQAEIVARLDRRPAA